MDFYLSLENTESFAFRASRTQYFNVLEISLITLIDWSNNTSAIDVKMDGSVL